MRHGDYRTQLKHYTVLGVTDTAAALAGLPAIALGEREAATARGGDSHDPLSETTKREEMRREAEGCETAGDATRTRNVQLGRLVLYH